MESATFGEALETTFFRPGSIFALLYLVGLVLTFRSRTKLRRTATLSIGGFACLLGGSLLYAASNIARLTAPCRVVNGRPIYDSGMMFIYQYLGFVTSFVGALLLLLAILKAGRSTGAA